MTASPLGNRVDEGHSVAEDDLGQIARRVYLHLGSAAGPSATPAWFVDGGQPFANLAWWLAGGDVNGDGFSDAVLGNPNSSGDRVLLYLGIP
ncbi:MAG TPA: FG-GAP repeat protein [Candidatus Polarisedimenticolia bacterium]|nr:FG-GAP repeat protein [Candidatus Polarisedimenticolia bacterium]